MVQQFMGRRLPDTDERSFPLPYDDLLPGDMWKCTRNGEPIVVTEYPSNLTQTHWMVVAPGPNGEKMIANLKAHTVRENSDGTVSVLPGDGSSNSILVKRRPGEEWHGYIYNNEWRAC